MRLYKLRPVAGAFGKQEHERQSSVRRETVSRHHECENDARMRILAETLAVHYSYDEILQIAENIRRDVMRRSEIEAMFAALSRMPNWQLCEEVIFRRQLIWADYGKYWRKTPDGRAYMRKFTRDYHARLKAEVVEVVRCKGCKKPFARTAYHVMRKRGRVCSAQCKGASRGNIALVTIGNESLPLTRWCERKGLKLSTVHNRVNVLGWGLERALNTPPAVRAQKGRAA